MINRITKAFDSSEEAAGLGEESIDERLPGLPQVIRDLSDLS